MSQVLKAIGVVVLAAFCMTASAWLFETTLGNYYRGIGFIVGILAWALILVAVKSASLLTQESRGEK